jgi:hypothetical protein
VFISEVSTPPPGAGREPGDLGGHLRLHEQLGRWPTSFTLDPGTDFAAGEGCTVTVFAAQWRRV